MTQPLFFDSVFKIGAIKRVARRLRKQSGIGTMVPAGSRAENDEKKPFPGNQIGFATEFRHGDATG
jgi:hypothetical protein